MKAVILLTILALASAKMAVNKYTLQEKGQMFENFLKNHNKRYEDPDIYQYRFQVFQHNLHRIAEMQEMSPDATFGATIFADLTEDEFVSTYLGYEEQPRQTNNTYKPTYGDAPASWDWREKGAVTPVKNQGQCGSCWAFSTTGNLEGVNFLTNGNLVALSEQQLVDCDKVDQGCNGGLMDQAFQWLSEHGGIESESDYPYKGVGEQCKFDESKVVVKVKQNSWHDITEGDEEAMKESIYANGPLSVAIHANGLQFYVGGVYNPIYCSKALNHGVLGVGYGTSDKGKDFWTIKNSWSAAWGEKGYFQIIRGKNMCGLAKACSYAEVESN